MNDEDFKKYGERLYEIALSFIKQSSINSLLDPRALVEEILTNGDIEKGLRSRHLPKNEYYPYS